MPPITCASHRTLHTHRRRRRCTALLITMLTLLAVTGVAPGNARAATATLPVTIRNTTDAEGPVYLYILGVDLTSADRDTLGYVDAAGSFHAWPQAAAGAPQAAPNVALPGPSDQASTTVGIPQGLSGRIY
ncbi:beta-1,3-glucanase family protein [Micropruina sp.]|uniref:beta-1,3-glucanase family protein n=1 Tax=Micropruina sp. TaxID=2737536 RepID=UPI0039E34EA3